MTLQFISELKRLRRKREDLESATCAATRDYHAKQKECDHHTLDGYRVRPQSNGSCPICLTPIPPL